MNEGRGENLLADGVERNAKKQILRTMLAERGENTRKRGEAERVFQREEGEWRGERGGERKNGERGRE